MKSRTGESLKFREAGSRRELESLLRFRYRAYRQGPFAGLCPENVAGIDLDGYDLTARHFGLYRGDEPVAYNRLIVGHPVSTTQWIREIAHGDRMLETRIAHRSGVVFPTLEVVSPGDGVEAVLAERRAAGRVVVEASRLCVAPQCRDGSIVTRMTTAVAVYCMTRHWDVLLSARPESRRYYRRFGFRTLGNMTDRYVSRWDAERCFLIGSDEWLEPRTRQLLEALAPEVCRAGGVLAA